jgi:hypothetical protein
MLKGKFHMMGFCSSKLVKLIQLIFLKKNSFYLSRTKRSSAAFVEIVTIHLMKNLRNCYYLHFKA